MDLFKWLRNAIRDAVIGGFGDGLHAVGLIDKDEAADAGKVRDALTERMAGPLTFPPIGEGPGEALDASKPNGRPHSKPRSRIGGKAGKA